MTILLCLIDIHKYYKDTSVDMLFHTQMEDPCSACISSNVVVDQLTKKISATGLKVQRSLGSEASVAVGWRKKHQKMAAGQKIVIMERKMRKEDADSSKKTQTGGWKSLGGILLCIIGSVAMFADLGHFSQLAIQVC